MLGDVQLCFVGNGSVTSVIELPVAPAENGVLADTCSPQGKVDSSGLLSLLCHSTAPLPEGKMQSKFCSKIRTTGWEEKEVYSRTSELNERIGQDEVSYLTLARGGSEPLTVKELPWKQCRVCLASQPVRWIWAFVLLSSCAAFLSHREERCEGD